MFVLGISMLALSLSAEGEHVPLPLSEPAPAPAPMDKARVYGSALLVPTPEGERARRELAAAGEYAALLEALPHVATAHATVSLRPRCQVQLVVTTGPDDPPLDHSTAEAMMPGVIPCADPTLRVWSSKAAAPADTPRGLPIPLVFSLVSLGVCVGIAAERLRNRSATASR